MATTTLPGTKQASVIKINKGSEKKWSEILSMNRRHDLQLPINIEKCNNDYKRAYNCYQRQQDQTERLREHKHKTWYRDDFLFRNHLLKQLKPITRRFRNVNSLSLQNNEDDDEQNSSSSNGILNLDENQNLPLKKSNKDKLPAINENKNCRRIQHFEFTVDAEGNPQTKTVFSKLICPKVLTEIKPRLDSFHHNSFLDVAQRFLKHKPELVEKGHDYDVKQKQQKQYLKNLIDNEQARVRLAAIKFQQQLENEKNKDTESSSRSEDSDYYY